MAAMRPQTAAAVAAAAAAGVRRQRSGVLRSRQRAARQALLACLIGLVAAVAGSPGDESPAFRRCHAHCLRTGCAHVHAGGGAAGSGAVGNGGMQHCSPLCPGNSAAGSHSGSGGSVGSTGSPASAPAGPLALLWTRWDCGADCSYLCMWQLEGSWPAGTPVQKYHGKWPFARLLGMQEPASVLFSLLNLAAHAHCLLQFRRMRRRQRQRQQRAPATAAAAAPARSAAAAAAMTEDGRCSGSSDGGGGSNGSTAASCANGSGKLAAATCAGTTPCRQYPYSWLWEGYMLLSINAWLWSAVFHSRDTRLTERLDYFSAAALIFFNLFLTVVRTARLRSPAALACVAAPLLFFLARHFHYMLHVRFDYGYHVLVCLGAGAMQSLLWVGWALAAAPSGRPHLLSFVGLVNACMLLEVLDFPPLWHALDAHSLWHLATVPLVYLFYGFIVADVNGGSASGSAKHKRM